PAPEHRLKRLADRREHVGDRAERAVLLLRDAAGLEPDVGRHAPPQLAHEARLADPRLAGDQDRPAAARLHPPPGVEELGELLAPPDERRLAHERARVEAGPGPPPAGHPEPGP